MSGPRQGPLRQAAARYASNRPESSTRAARRSSAAISPVAWWPWQEVQSPGLARGDAYSEAFRTLHPADAPEDRTAGPHPALPHVGPALVQLRPARRRALQLVHVEGHTFASAGAVLGCSKQNTHRLVRRARADLRALLVGALDAEAR